MINRPHRYVRGGRRIESLWTSTFEFTLTAHLGFNFRGRLGQSFASSFFTSSQQNSAHTTRHVRHRHMTSTQIHEPSLAFTRTECRDKCRENWTLAAADLVTSSHAQKWPNGPPFSWLKLGDNIDIFATIDGYILSLLQTITGAHCRRPCT
jgi:hypothetical protein